MQTKEVIVIVRPEQHFPTVEAVTELGIEEIMEQRVLGRGQQGGLRYLRPVARQQFEAIVQFLPKRMLTLLVPEEKVATLVETIIRTNGTSSFGDGKIFVCPLEGVDGNVE